VLCGAVRAALRALAVFPAGVAGAEEERVGAIAEALAVEILDLVLRVKVQWH
jgi:hypothetical protein